MVVLDLGWLVLMYGVFLKKESVKKHEGQSAGLLVLVFGWLLWSKNENCRLACSC